MISSYALLLDLFPAVNVPLIMTQWAYSPTILGLNVPFRPNFIKITPICIQNLLTLRLVSTYVLSCEYTWLLLRVHVSRHVSHMLRRRIVALLPRDNATYAPIVTCGAMSTPHTRSLHALLPYACRPNKIK